MKFVVTAKIVFEIDAKYQCDAENIADEFLYDNLAGEDNIKDFYVVSSEKIEGGN